jgi:hypothetical protein
METFIIKVPEKKSKLVKQLLKELGVTVDARDKKSKIPNALTAKTIEDAHNGIGLGKPIKDINIFVKSL